MNHLTIKGKKVRADFLNDLFKSGMSVDEIKELMEDADCRSFINAFCDLIAKSRS
jgi:hypothetical protein